MKQSKIKTIKNLTDSFEETAYIEDGIEYWFARDLQKLLQYSKWENFLKVLDKAKISCRKSKQKT